MRIKTSLAIRTTLLISLIVSVTGLSTRLQADTGSCGTGPMTSVPFIDVMGNPFFCQIAEAYFSGLTNGTDATHYSPAANVPREQIAAFATRTMDQSLMRGHNRAALNQFWTDKAGTNLGLTTLPASSSPQMIRSDGADLWVASPGTATLTRVRASDGKLLDTWTGATGAFGVLVAMGKVFVAGTGGPGHLYSIDPTLAGTAVTLVTNVPNPLGIAFDGQRIWLANQGAGSVSIVTVNPLSVSTVSMGFTNLSGIVFDGTNMWVTDSVAGSVDKLRQLNASGGIIQSVDVGDDARFPVFDGTNIWVPNQTSSTVTVVRATGPLAGKVLANLSLNGLSGPWCAAFDGERILVTNISGNSVSLWKASDLSPIVGPFPTGASTSPQGACSDGLNFWISLTGANKLARF